MVNQNICFEYTDRPVSAWGGMRLMKELVDKSGIRQQLTKLDLPFPGSNRGFSPVQIMESFWVSVWTGASRFTHSGWLRYDKVLQEIFQWKRAPSQSTYSRFFHKFSWKRNTEVFIPLNQWFFQQLTLDNITVDLDSSVITRYGEQEGSKRGYNPGKPGRASHHPLMAFLPQTRMVINAWLRPGNTGSASNMENFLEETFRILQDKKVGLVRADSGFYGDDYLKYFENENRKLNYVVSAKLTRPLKWELLGAKNWTQEKGGIQLCEFFYQAHGWNAPRRMIAARQQIDKRPKATGKKLFTEEELGGRYRYSVFVTNLNLPADEIWKMYRHRADAENRIKELKYDFSIDAFCLKKFWATEAAFRSIMLAYNLMSLFRHTVLQTASHATLSTLKFKCFAIGSWLATHAGKKVLKLSVSGQKRLWLDGLFAKVGDVSPPFVFSNA
jgi:hypothetical protein